MFGVEDEMAPKKIKISKTDTEIDRIAREIITALRSLAPEEQDHVFEQISQEMHKRSSQNECAGDSECA